MAKSSVYASQSYPRISNEMDKYFGFLNESKLKAHSKKFPYSKLKKIIADAITYASKKSSRVILNIPEGSTRKQKDAIYKKQGRELFAYFIRYCGDPASTAHDSLSRHYSKVAIEQFRNRTVQKERMNSGWRYQYIAKDAAIESKRFISVSDIGASEADFNAIILERKSTKTVNIYVSIKNRTNTMGGQDWPKAISALENVARNDKNRKGPYVCVFGIAMEKGMRNIRAKAGTKIPYSANTEVWLSDFFWPFFANYKYEEIIKAVLEVLIEQGANSTVDIEIPKGVIDSFGEVCREYKLLDKKGNFNDAFKLVDLFCGKLKI